MPRDACRGCHGGTDEVSAASRALPAFEISIGRRSAALSGRELVVIHAETHRAAGFAPLKAGFLEYLVQPFAFRLRLHQSGTGYDHGKLHAIGLVPAPH